MFAQDEFGWPERKEPCADHRELLVASIWHTSAPASLTQNDVILMLGTRTFCVFKLC